MQEVLEKALEFYGTERQILKTIEELAELQRALSRYLAGTDSPKDMAAILMNIAEEKADVDIMLRQMEIVFGDCAAMKDVKLKRLNERMK